MLSGLNNLSKYNIENYEFAQYYGIGEEDIAYLYKAYGITEDI